jgi:Dehydrogenases with different specificities (related to short-chain alcohol dehydrogenases)
VKTAWQSRTAFAHAPATAAGSCFATASFFSHSKDPPVTDAAASLPPTAPVVAIHPMLSGQKAIVTGANSGIGRGVALALGQAGADVCVNHLGGEDAANEVVDQLHGFGVKAFACQADVSREDQVAEMFRQAIAQFGTVDILVANAGLQRDAAFHAMTLEQWNTVIGVNLTGQFLCAREAVREFLRRGVVPSVSSAAGKIICMSSVHQQIPWAGHANYASSKGGIKMLMESLAQEVAPQRIRVNAIAPGAIRTPINTSAWNTPEAYGQLMKLVPYGRIGEPEDIARAAVWLASDQSDYVVGTTLYVDGGMTLYPGFATGG